RGFYSPGSSIPVRLLVRDAKTPLDAAFFRERVARAAAWRARLGLGHADEAHKTKTDGFRLVHAEGDGLPGLIVDRFGDVLVVQLAEGQRVLDAYCYVGPFAMAAARGGAREVLAVDDSAAALEVAAECARANGLESRIQLVRRDARKALQEAGAAGGYDVVV